MRIDSGFVEPFDFAAVGARQPTSRARVLEVRIQSPPAESQQTFGSSQDDARARLDAVTSDFDFGAKLDDAIGGVGWGTC